MPNHNFPQLDANALIDTREACHGYASVLGGWTASCRLRRKHWWQLSLRPSLHGVTTGVTHAEGVHFELVLALSKNQAWGEIAGGSRFSVTLGDQSAEQLGDTIRTFLIGGGVPERLVPESVGHESHGSIDGSIRRGYSAEIAAAFAQTWREVAAVYTDFQASIPEETSPINLWPGHFDMAMMWLGGEKIPGEDPANEEYADKQMNFGFSFGDGGIPEPYFYVTAYPSPSTFPHLALPGDAFWEHTSFSGAVLRYRHLVEAEDPHAVLLEFLHCLLDYGREHVLEQASRE